jgi:E3 ubiquitin-protein ligase MARCH6
VAEEQMANGQLQEPVVANAVIVPPPSDDILPPLPIIAPIVPQGLGDVHQAMMQGGAPVGFQPYKHPNLFALRLLCLVALLCFTLFLASLASLLIPVYIGRRLMGIWTGEAKIHELYTVACGLYACWVALRMAMILYTWIPQGWRVIFDKVVEWTVLVSKSVFIAVMLIGIVPLMLGLIFELVIVMPIRVPLEMTPIFFPWQDWALGVLHAKIITAATMMGPQWRLKRVIEQVYQQGLRNVNLKYVMVELCLPVVVCLGLILAVPHIIAKSIVPAFGCDFETQNLVLRRIYPFILGVVLFVAFCIFQARQFRRLYEHIKNDKYLVGQRLVNYDRHQS